MGARKTTGILTESSGSAPALAPESEPKVGSALGEKVKIEDDLRSQLKQLVIGQDEAVDAIIPFIHMHKAGLVPPGKPIATILLLGGTGSGKTHTVQSVAELLHGSGKNLLRVDCGEYQMEHEVAKLLGCFAPQTPVLLADGGLKAIEDVGIGDVVVSKDGRTNEVLDTHSYEYNGDMQEISFSSHSEPLVATPDHKIWAIKTGKVSGRVRNPKSLYDPARLSWIRAEDIEKNDIIVYPRFAEPNAPPIILDLRDYSSDRDHRELQYDGGHVWYQEDHKVNRFVAIDENFARIAGYFVSDGYAREGKGGITFCLGVPQKSSVVDDLLITLPKIFGGNLRPRVEDRGSCKKVHAGSKILAALFGSLFGRGAENKKLPDFFITLPDPLLWQFLSGAIACDGSVSVNRRVEYSTVSENLYSQIQLIIRKLGFTSQIQKSSSSVQHWLDRYRIYVAGEQIERFAEQLPKIGNRSIGLDNSGNGGIQRQSHVDDDYIYFRVTDNKKIPYKGLVYDISVDKDPSYVAGGISVSNSPPGYLGHKETQAALSQAKVNSVISPSSDISVILFDEIEKAAFSVSRLLLGLMDRGSIQLGDNTVVNFEKSLVFMTSNLGAKEIQDLANPSWGFQGSVGGAVALTVENVGTAAVRKKFSPEFINRVDATLTFKPLGRDSFNLILDKLIESVQSQIISRLGIKGFIICVAEPARDKLLDMGTSVRYGARELKRVFYKAFVYPLAELCYHGKVPPGTRVTLIVSGDKFDIQISNK